MPDRGKVFEAFRNCITEPKCRDCPWEQCEQFNQKKVSIPVTLALDVLNLLKEHEIEEPHPWEHIWDAPDYTFKCRCRKCGFIHYFIQGHDAQYRFCPQCGEQKVI